ncbi:aspartate racemase [Clostridium sp. CAG:273]|nr:amino acid racemase [Clostridia bacterium]CDE83869.1 aspartate racemase [Clostridium sp. CAG:273]
MNKKVLGVIGGMGTAATIDFYTRIMNHTVAHKDQEHIDMVIINHASIIDRTYAIKNNKLDELLKQMHENLKILENAKVTSIAIPCNTSHSIIDKIQQLTSIPIINMIEETAKGLKEVVNKGEKVGIMATDGTIMLKIYQQACKKYDIEYFVPEDNIQKQIMDIIYDDVKANGIFDNERFKKVLDYFLQNGCKYVILGCTELSGFKKDFDKNTIDPMDYLVKAAILSVDKEYKD